MKSMKI